MAESWLRPDWPAPPNVGALSSTRGGGVSSGPYASLNLGDHVGDIPEAVAENRRRFSLRLPTTPEWLEQVHGCEVAVLDGGSVASRRVDAAITRTPGRVCAVMTADCLPVLFCDRAGSVVAAAHAGWRGLHAGVLENTVRAMGEAPGDLLAWFGPAIGPAAFEVGDEVREAFVAADGGAAAAFVRNERGRWLADLYRLARRRLNACGVVAISGGERCTYGEAAMFFSYRRDGVTGRMASAVWITPSADGTPRPERA